MISNKFKIICVSDCQVLGFQGDPSSRGTNIKIGDVFVSDDYDFNHGVNIIRLFSEKNLFLGLYKKSNFKKLDEFRNEKIETILE